jgi:hypothetical protein
VQHWSPAAGWADLGPRSRKSTRFDVGWYLSDCRLVRARSRSSRRLSARAGRAGVRGRPFTCSPLVRLPVRDAPAARRATVASAHAVVAVRSAGCFGHSRRPRCSPAGEAIDRGHFIPEEKPEKRCERSPCSFGPDGEEEPLGSTALYSTMFVPVQESAISRPTQGRLA